MWPREEKCAFVKKEKKLEESFFLQLPENPQLPCPGRGCPRLTLLLGSRAHRPLQRRFPVVGGDWKRPFILGNVGMKLVASDTWKM